jgi:hypothetical protein
MQQQMLLEVEVQRPPTPQKMTGEPVGAIVLSMSLGYCRECGGAIRIPGLNASLCSNPDRTCGSSGWVSNRQIVYSRKEAA